MNLLDILFELEEIFAEQPTKKVSRYVIADPEHEIDRNLSKGFNRRNTNPLLMMAKKVIFAKPKTIVLWKDGSKTIVTAQKGEKFDKEKGVLMAYYKRFCGSHYMSDLDAIIESADDIDAKK